MHVQNAVRGEAGFSYLALMIGVAVLTLTSASALVAGSVVQRREAERRLLEVGGAYRRAIASYVDAGPAGERTYPGSLADLLRDPRDAGVRRHLRRLYTDPVSGKADWGLVPAPGGGIAGVHSLSDAAPIKVAGFDADDAAFEGATRYSDWVFAVAPDASPDPAAARAGTPATSAPSPRPAADAAVQPGPSLFSSPAR